MLTRCRALSLAGLALLVFAATACQKVPLLAPTGSTITLTAPTNALSANGSVDIVAQVLEAAGTPPHSGTHIIFTTTLGRIDPADASTDGNGRVSVKYTAGSASGTAIITASSGGATTGSNGAVRIAVGSAAVGRVNLSANPNPISANGGVATISANVIDLNGNTLAAVPVSFSTTAGVLGNSVVNTDASGAAQTTLSTTSQATVTATVGVQSSTGAGSTGTGTGTGTGTSTGTTSTQATATITVNVNPLPTVSISAPTGTLTANSPIVFTLNVAVAASSTAQVRSVIVDFGDGTRNDLGAATGSALTVAHQFSSEGTYVVRVTVIDSLGGTTQAATAVVVQPEPPLAVSIASSSVASGGNTTTTFTATVTPTTTTVASYVWNFGDGTSSPPLTSPQVVHVYSTGSGAKTVTLTITTTTGRTATGQIVVNP